MTDSTGAVTMGAGASIFGTGGASTTAGAGSMMTTELPSADACAVPPPDRRTVTRVSRLPISVTSSAVMALTPAGSCVGVVRVAALVVPERSTTNWSGVGLRDVNAGAPLVFRMICGAADDPVSIAFKTMAVASAGAGCGAGFAGLRCLHHDADAPSALRTSMLAISRIRWTLLILPTFTISRPSTHLAQHAISSEPQG